MSDCDQVWIPSDLQTKRHKMRLQIRNKHISQYHQSIRRLQMLQEIQENNKANIFYTETPAFKLENMKQNCLEYLEECENMLGGELCERVDEERELSVEQIEQRKIFWRLEELSLSAEQRVCEVSVLMEIYEYIQKLPIQMFYDKIDGIMMKIAINERYWNEELLVIYIELMSKLKQKGVSIDEYLLNMSDGCCLQMRVVLYRQILQSKILHCANNMEMRVSKSKRSKNSIDILHNLLIKGPAICHVQLSPSSIQSLEYISKLIELLTDIIKNMSPSQEMCGRNICPFLGLLISLLQRFQSYEMISIVVEIDKQGWKLIQYVMNVCEEYFMGLGSNDIKIKLKIIQICNIILYMNSDDEQDNQNHQLDKMILKFLYAFLPTLLSIIASDLPQIKLKSIERDSISELERAYERELLSSLSNILSIKDQLNEIPALSLLNIKHPSLLQFLHTKYCQIQTQKNKNVNFVGFISGHVLTIKNTCGIGWMVQFVRSIINSEYFCEDVVKNILFSRILQALQEHEHDQRKGHKEQCLMLLLLKQRHIRNILEQISQKHEEAESLLDFISEREQQF